MRIIIDTYELRRNIHYFIIYMKDPRIRRNIIRRWYNKHTPGGYRFPTNFHCSCGAVNQPGVFSCPKCGGFNVPLHEYNYSMGYTDVTLAELLITRGENSAKAWARLDYGIRKSYLKEKAWLKRGAVTVRVIE